MNSVPKKRGAGDGTIAQRKDGRWCARVRYVDPLTKLQSRAIFYGKTRQEAADKLREAQNRIAGRQSARQQGVRLRDFLDRWMREVVEPTLRDTTRRSYKNVVEKHLKPSALGDLKLRDLNEAQIQHVLISKKKRATRTQVLTLVVLRRALDRAVLWKLLDANPAKLVSSPRQERAERHPLTPEQARAFLKEAKHDRLYMLYHLALDTGMRQGELLALRWQDIVDGVIRVNRSLDANTMEIVAPKTRSGRRAIVLNPRVLTELAAHRDRQRARGHDGELVFTDSRGGPLRPSNFHRNSFRPLLLKAGISSSVRFHDLRHTSATLLLAAGVNLKIASERLGHANIATTADIYAHVTSDMQRDAARKMGKLLTPVPDKAAESVRGRGRKSGRQGARKRTHKK